MNREDAKDAAEKPNRKGRQEGAMSAKGIFIGFFACSPP